MKKITIGLFFLIIIIIGAVLYNEHLLRGIVSKNVSAGEQIYHKQCFTCHGNTGKGEGTKVGTAINNQHFLSSVSNKDLYNYVKFGRKGTTMPAYGQSMSEKELKNLVDFLRNWQIAKIKFDVHASISGNLEKGKIQYHLYCQTCHGEAGAGKDKMGTALASPEYLKYTTYQQIWIPIAYGRENTRMGPSLKGLDGVRQLKKQDISDIVSYIRSLKTKK